MTRLDKAKGGRQNTYQIHSDVPLRDEASDAAVGDLLVVVGWAFEGRRRRDGYRREWQKIGEGRSTQIKVLLASVVPLLATQFKGTLRTLRKRSRLLARLALLAWMGLIIFLSSRSSMPTDSPLVERLGQYQDEVGHLGEYAVLGMLTYAVLRPYLNGRRTLIFSLAFCIAFSLADEGFQGTIPNRTPQFIDVLLDAVGAVGALAMLSALGPRIRTYLPRSLRGPD